MSRIIGQAPPRPEQVVNFRELRRPLVQRIRSAVLDPWAVYWPGTLGGLPRSARFAAWSEAYAFAHAMACDRVAL